MFNPTLIAPVIAPKEWHTPHTIWALTIGLVVKYNSNFPIAVSFMGSLEPFYQLLKCAHAIDNFSSIIKSVRTKIKLIHDKMKKCDPELTGNKKVDRGGTFYL